MFEIKKITDREIWENFLLDCKEKTFLQSWNWGEFNKATGDKITRFGAYQKEDLVATTLVIKVKARRGTFLFLPHGPNVKFGNKELKKGILESFLEKLKVIAREEEAVFIRIAPIWERNEENMGIFKELGFREAPIHIHPELTWELDIKPSEEELLTKMRKTTRYLIRRASKNDDVEIVKSWDIKEVKGFDDIYQTTKDRHHFIPFSLNYLEDEFSSFASDKQISVFLGKYKGEIVSSGIFVFWQNTGFYHHGASSLRYPKIPVSYMLLWEAIKTAKEKGCEKFNFWGIAPTSSKKHPWAGLSLFKMGFGGETKEYVKTQDFILSSKYWFSFIIEKLRKIRRGL